LRRPIHPDSWRRAAVDVFALLVLLYDSITIPFFLAWDLPFHGWIAAFSWSTTLFWFVDLILGFCTGYHQKERVVMDFGKIAKRYLIRGFVPNLCVFSADLVGNIMEIQSGAGDLSREKTYIKLTRFIKLNRVYRLSHMLRHGRVAQIWDAVATTMRKWGVHEQFNFMTSVLRLVFYIVWVNHLMGCLWHMIGAEATARWYDEKNLVRQAAGGDAFEYMLGVYWSASSMIAGGSIMTPTTSWELAATILCIVFGFIFSSVLISSLLTTVMEYQEANKERHQRLKKLRQFLYQHKVRSWLAMPIVKQVNERMAITTRLSEGDVAALSLLSPMMRSELWCHIYRSSLMQNPFLCACSTLYDGLVKDVCFHTLKHTAFGPGARIFEPGVEAVGAHFVGWGAFEYALVGGNSSLGGLTSSPQRSMAASGSMLTEEEGPLAATKGAWISEAAILAHWLHRGWLDATQTSELITVQAKPLVGIFASHSELLQFVRAFSQTLLAALEQEPAETLSDLHMLVRHESVVAAMPLDARISLSSAAFEVFMDRNQWSGHVHEPKGVEELKLELENGECDLMVDSLGEVYRSVTIVALRLQRSGNGDGDAAVLTQIGKVVNGVWVSHCQPPGTKVKVGESSRMAIQRLIRQKLEAFSGDVHLDSFSVDVEDRPSLKYGLHSKYLRSLFEGDVLEPESGYKLVLHRETEGNVDAPTRFDAFIFRSDWERKAEPLFIYAWLPPEAIDFLESDAGAPLLKQWVDELSLARLTIMRGAV